MQPDVESSFETRRLRVVHHRPFVKQWLYFDPLYIERIGHIPDIYPSRGVTAEERTITGSGSTQAESIQSGHANQAIYITGRGASVAFSALITDTTPDFHFLSGGQAFPRYRYETDALTHSGVLDFDNQPTRNRDKPGTDGRVDNITDWCLYHFRQHYNIPSITKDDIWAYIYGVLHAEDWRTRYANDLRKGLPRVPLAPDFWAFRDAGQQLIDLHLGYETCKPWPLTITARSGIDDGSFYRIDGMRWDRTRGSDGKLADNRSVLVVNSHCSIEDIPDESHLYIVNGKTPLEWAIARLKTTTDKASGITNDPNQWHEWADQPYNLILHLQRLVRMSVETHRIVSGLPPALTPDN